MNVGNYIKELRISRGLSQEELGKIVGVQRAAVQKWEAGKVYNLKKRNDLKARRILRCYTRFVLL